MVPVLPLPRLILASGALSILPQELALLGIAKPLLVSDRGLEKAGAVSAAMKVLPASTAYFLDVPPNPTTDGTDAAYAVYRNAKCDGVIALGGGSVIDTAKIVIALAAGTAQKAIEFLGKPENIGINVAPLIAIPTTIGTGSESSHVSALHVDPHSPAIGTRHPRLVPRVAICDPDLVRTLPRHLIAATGFDALSHCLEGYCSEPANPIVDALALDGITRAYTNIHAALEPNGDAARTNLMVAAFSGGVCIHKGLGPAHSVALACSDQDLHHGALIAGALPLTTAVVLAHIPTKAARIAAAMGLGDGEDIPTALLRLVKSLDLPQNYIEAGYKAGSVDTLVDLMVSSPANRASPYVPTPGEFRTIAKQLLLID